MGKLWWVLVLHTSQKASGAFGSIYAYGQDGGILGQGRKGEDLGGWGGLPEDRWKWWQRLNR